MGYSTNPADYSVWENVRSDLADEIEQHWVGHEESITGLQYLELRQGRVYVRSFHYERCDVLVIQDWDYANIFIDPGHDSDDNEPSWHVDPWTERVLAESRLKAYDTVARKVIVEHKDYIDHERRFLQTKPWMQVNGMTPSEAVARMRELGW
jgi:hypothetical protein